MTANDTLIENMRRLAESSRAIVEAWEREKVAKPEKEKRLAREYRVYIPANRYGLNFDAEDRVDAFTVREILDGEIVITKEMYYQARTNTRFTNTYTSMADELWEELVKLAEGNQ